MKSKNKSRADRSNEVRDSAITRNRKLNLILTSVLAVSAIAIVVLLFLGRDTGSSSSHKLTPVEESHVEQASALAPSGHGPSIHFPESEFDFGSIDQGAKVSHTFVVQNRGDEPLKLIRAKGSWGCTAAVLTETDIPPGGEGKIEVTFDSGHKKGQQKKTITVESSDQVSPRTTLYVSALIDVLFGFELNRLDFGRLPMGETATKTAVLILKDQSKRNLLTFNSSSPNVTVETTNSVELDKSRIEVRITLTPEVPAGRLNETVTARLSDNSHPASNLSIRGSIVGNIEITPETMRLTADTSQSVMNQAEQSVRVVSTRGDFRFELKGVSEPNGYLNLEIDTAALGEKYTIRARPSNKALGMGRNLAGEVKVLTSDAGQPEVTFRYNIVFSPR